MHFKTNYITKLIILLMCFSFSIMQASVSGLDGLTQKRTIFGTIKDEKGIPFLGANVLVKSTTNGTMTDFDGKFTLNIDENSKTLVISYVGYETKEIRITDRTEYIISLEPDVEGLDAVVVVGFGTQKKASLVSAITTINPKEIKGPTSNLTAMLAGRISGVISYQRSGEPGADNSEFFIRGLGSFGAGKRDPLILVDGIESSTTDMARLQPDDIEAFSVLKDASAAAIYGARGANGVVLITTKSGKDGKLKFNFRLENRYSFNTKNFKFADNITYMNLANEAALTRNPLAAIPYSRLKIDRTAAGINPYLYPSNDWIDKLIQDYTVNSGYNFSVSGGGQKARYYVASTYNIDNGILKVDNRNNFNNNIKLRNYSLRSNLNMNFTPTTEGAIRLYGQFDDYNGPIGGGTNIFNQAVWSNPVAFPAVYPKEYLPYIKHPLFGGAVIEGSLLSNPYAEMVKGYQIYKSSTIQTQLEIKQNLKGITKGLSARAMAYVRRFSTFKLTRQYLPYFYSSNLNPVTNEIDLTLINHGGLNSIGTPGRETLDYAQGDENLDSRIYLETAINYNRTFNKKHAVSGMLINLLSSYETGNSGALQSSLPHRNHSFSGRFTYGYEGRYLAELNFGYNGSERFAKNKRYGFFPSLALGYVVSKEKFFEPLKDIVTNLKLRGSYGLIGNDAIGSSSDRFFYLSEVNLANYGYGSTFGQEFGYWQPGVSISRYENVDISWEKSRQTNLGIDLKLFNSLELIADVFKQRRTNILQQRSNIGSTFGLSVIPSTNFGVAESKGLDASLSYNKQFSNNWWANLRGNFTYATNEIIKYDETNYPEELSYLLRKGQSIAQAYGYIADRLFVDDREAENSPRQFGEYGGGDIKYRDVNGDGVITQLDKVPMGYPTTPEITFGFGGTLGYKNFDFSLFFQGSARSSFYINPQNISPFVVNGRNQNGLLKVIAEDHWSEDNRNSYAFWPRLSSTFIENNNQTSSWWMRNGAFLRLKNVQLGFNAPDHLTEKIGVNSLRLYTSAFNLGVISKFKLWDPEMGGNGLGYPIQAVYNFGLQINL